MLKGVVLYVSIITELTETNTEILSPSTHTQCLEYMAQKAWESNAREKAHHG